jgi:hypothetical protein
LHVLDWAFERNLLPLDVSWWGNILDDGGEEGHEQPGGLVPRETILWLRARRNDMLVRQYHRFLHSAAAL